MQSREKEGSQDKTSNGCGRAYPAIWTKILVRGTQSDENGISCKIAMMFSRRRYKIMDLGSSNHTSLHRDKSVVSYICVWRLVMSQLGKRAFSLPLYIVLSISPDVRQQAKSKRSACCGSSSAFKDAERPLNPPFSWSILDVIVYN